MALMLDNASNNDTMVETIEDLCTHEGIYFSAAEARMRCMPHTVHLSALKVSSLYHLVRLFLSLIYNFELLDGIGAFGKHTSSEAALATTQAAYQDSVTAPLSRQHDDLAAHLHDSDESNPELEDANINDLVESDDEYYFFSIKSTVAKVG